MLLSHKHKFIFIAVPKTGSTSVRSSLRKYSDYESNSSKGEVGDKKTSFLKNHSTLSVVKNYIDLKNMNFSDYKSFGFARNPWDREVSFFKYFKKHIFIYKSLNLKENSVNIDNSFAKYCYDRKSQAINFGDFLKNRTLNFEKNRKPRMCCYDFLYDAESNTEANFIGKLENFDEDLVSIFKILNLPTPEIRHLNKTKHEHYSSFYKEQSWIEIVEEVYYKDIEKFNYKFHKKS